MFLNLRPTPTAAGGLFRRVLELNAQLDRVPLAEAARETALADAARLRVSCHVLVSSELRRIA